MREAEKTILVTGAAGFIGSFLCDQLIQDEDFQIVGVDNLNDYYDVSLKESRLRMINEHDSNNVFHFELGDLANQSFVEKIFTVYQPQIVVHFAAQAGVRYSIENPRAYIDSNIIGFFNILEACRHNPVEHLVFASSSSVYGTNKKVPYSIDDRVDNPVSLYAATKKSDELLAHAYSKLYAIPVTGLRFFTVYGPMGRPDMAYFKFADLMKNGKAIDIYNYGDMRRDFTYIDDIVSGVRLVMNAAPVLNEDDVRYKIYNIGNSSPVSLITFIKILENCMLREGLITDRPEHNLLPMQPGDVYQTYADVSDLEADFGFRPTTELEDGLNEFVKWYKSYVQTN